MFGVAHGFNSVNMAQILLRELSLEVFPGGRDRALSTAKEENCLPVYSGGKASVYLI